MQTRWITLAPALALLLAACGGGGDGATGPDPSPNRLPTASIDAPEEGATFAEGESVTFEGSGQDPEDGTLSGSSLVWEDASGEQVGTGETVTLSLPSTGDHEMTLIAEDSDGATDSDVVSITVVSEPPAVFLDARLPRPDLDFTQGDLQIADGEAVSLRWDTENGADSCTASGGWSGARGISGTETTSSLPGPAEHRFILDCENALGSAADTVLVDVGAPGERHAVSNRPDVSSSPKIKFFYMTCEGCVDREFDLDGSLEDAFKLFQDRFESETGRRFRVDTYDGGYDITFVVVDQEKLDQARNPSDVKDAMREELQERGLYEKGEDSYILVQFFNGVDSNDLVGAFGGGHEAWMIRRKPPLTGNLNPATFGHEIIHADGHVDSDAPNFDEEHPGHVDDNERDLMYWIAPDISFIIDPGCDDYYCESGLPEGVKNLAESPFLLPEGE